MMRVLNRADDPELILFGGRLATGIFSTASNERGGSRASKRTCNERTVGVVRQTQLSSQKPSTLVRLLVNIVLPARNPVSPDRSFLLLVLNRPRATLERGTSAQNHWPAVQNARHSRCHLVARLSTLSRQVHVTSA